jgi:hypothetical protein
VTLYAVWGWDGLARAANVFFGNTNAQIVYQGVDPSNAVPTSASFTKIGAALANSIGAVNGYWQGPGGATVQGQVGGMIFVIGTNHPPVTYPIAMIATNGLPSSTNVFSGAWIPTDADGDQMTVTVPQSSSAHGGTASTDGINLTYLNSIGYNGLDTFNYVVSDGFGGFSTNIVSVNVSSGTVNQPPVAGPQVMGAVSGQPATLKIIGGVNGPTDPNNDPLTITAVGTPANGTASSPNGTNVTYTSTSGYTGTDMFTYTVGDGQGGFATNTVTVSVVSAVGYNHLATPVRSGSNYNVSFKGTPYAYYVLLTTSSLTVPMTWIPVVTNQADATTGMITFSFTPSSRAAFYKTSTSP